jgi:hypothetical protein
MNNSMNAEMEIPAIGNSYVKDVNSKQIVDLYRLESGFEEATQFLCWLKSNGEIVRANRVCREATGLPVNEGDFFDVINWWGSKGELRKTLNECIAKAAKNLRVKQEIQVGEDATKATFIDLSIRRINEADGKCMLLVEATDISRFRRLENLLRDTVSHLQAAQS